MDDIKSKDLLASIGALFAKRGHMKYALDALLSTLTIDQRNAVLRDALHRTWIPGLSK